MLSPQDQPPQRTKPQLLCKGHCETSQDGKLEAKLKGIQMPIDYEAMLSKSGAVLSWLAETLGRLDRTAGVLLKNWADGVSNHNGLDSGGCLCP